MKTKYEGKLVNFPDFLLVGAVRGGTTSLHAYIKQHPQIFMPEEKEPQFFAFSEKPTKFKHPPIMWKLQEYLNLFESAKEGQILGEASLGYFLCHEETIKNIKKYIADFEKVKIIVSLRNPIERVVSLHAIFSQEKLEPLPLEEAIKPEVIRHRMKEGWGPWFDYIRAGYSFEPAEAFLKNFSNVKIFLYEELRANTPAVMKDIFAFLGVDDSFSPDVSIRHNPSIGPLRFKNFYDSLEKPGLVSSKLPMIKYLIPLAIRAGIMKAIKHRPLKVRKKIKANKDIRIHLKNIYKEDILKLQALLGRDLSRWLE